MTPDPSSERKAVQVSVGVFAWNEERALPAMLGSVFQQTFFGELCVRGWHSSLVCVTNGCTDRTAQVATEIFNRQKREHPFAKCFSTKVANLPQRGKTNAWNRYVHELAPPQASYLFMMDADIVIHQRDTLSNMLDALETNPVASVAVDRPRKHIVRKRSLSFLERLSLSASQMTQAAPAQLCGQLYCIRGAVARNIYLPKDLAACEDGFIKSLVCTDFLTEQVRPERIQVAEKAEHTFEAYTSPVALLKNQKRQILGQTIVHILVDNYLKNLSPSERHRLAVTIRARDTSDPTWLQRLIRNHLLQIKGFWQLYPGLLEQRFTRWARLPRLSKLRCLPATVAGSAAALLASFLAYRSLRRGCTDYWPKATRSGLAALPDKAGLAGFVPATSSKHPE